MSKGKGVFAVIAAILVVGLGITSYTSHYINKQSSSSPPPTMAGAPMMEETVPSTDGKTTKSAEAYDGAVSVAGEAASPEAGAGAAPRSLEEEGSAAAAAETTAASPLTASVQVNSASSDTGETGGSAADGKDAKETLLISPISGLPEVVKDETEEISSLSADEQKEAYLKRLDDLNTQIDKLWKDTEATSTAMKQTAEYELKMWDNELNKIYQEYRAILDEADAEALRQVELQWIKDRDAKALAASKQVSNGTLESLEYTRTLAEATKARTYELVEQYFEEGGAK